MTARDLNGGQALARPPLKRGRRQVKERTRPPIDAAQFGVANPIRLGARTLLHENELSPGEIADALGEDVRVVSHHMRALYDAGCIEFVGHEGNEGNVRRAVYRAIARPVVSDEAYRSMSLE